MELGLREKSCVVTGASSGIGRAVALLLASEGAAVLLVARGEERLAAVQAECEHVGARAAERLVLDVTDPEAGERLAAVSPGLVGPPDVLVNNAGTSAAKSLDQLTEDDWRAQWELHVMGPMRLMRAVVPGMADRGFGRVVNVASSSGKRPSGTNMAYSVTKAAVLSLSRAFADLYADRGVLVNAVAPGPVGGELWLREGGLADQIAAARGISRDEVLDQTAARTPVGRLGSEEEIAAVIAFLCSTSASYVTGAAWSVDGGTVPVII